jgi:hypothetical protein
MSQRAELLEADVVRLEALVRDDLGTMVRCLQIRAEGRGLVLRRNLKPCSCSFSGVITTSGPAIAPRTS